MHSFNNDMLTKIHEYETDYLRIYFLVGAAVPVKQ